jgi:hypothetical protein
MRLTWKPRAVLIGMALLGTLVPEPLALASDPAKAEELIRQANDLRRQGKDPAAIPLLRQAYEIARSPRTAAQLGLVELALGYWVEAERHLAEALAPSSHPWIDRNREVLGRSLSTARAHLGVVIVEGLPQGADVFVNDTLVGTLPLPRSIRVGEGSVTIEVRSSRYATQTRTLELLAGSTERVSVSLAPLDEAPSPPTRPAPLALRPTSQVPSIDASRPAAVAAGVPTWRRAIPWGLAAATVAVGGFAVWQHVSWQNGVSDFDALPECGTARDQRGTNGRCQALYASFISHRSRAFAGYGLAGALGVAATLTFVWSSDAHDPLRSVVVNGLGTPGLSFAGSF